MHFILEHALEIVSGDCQRECDIDLFATSFRVRMIPAFAAAMKVTTHRFGKMQPHWRAGLVILCLIVRLDPIVDFSTVFMGNPSTATLNER
jgi:hypothetical protein